MSKTLEEWIENYNLRTKTKFKFDERFKLFFLPEKGFCEISCDEDKILVGAVSGDGKFWKSFADNIAMNAGKEFCGAICVRKKIFAFIRLFGHKIETIYENKNLHGILTKDKGGNFAFWAETIFENGEHGYKILWQVPKVVSGNEI